MFREKISEIRNKFHCYVLLEILFSICDISENLVDMKELCWENLIGEKEIFIMRSMILIRIEQLTLKNSH